MRQQQQIGYAIPVIEDANAPGAPAGDAEAGASGATGGLKKIAQTEAETPTNTETQPDTETPSDAERLSELFWSVARRLRHSSRQSLAPWDIAPSHSRALSVLMQHQALRLSDLSDHLHIAPRSTTDVVDGLQERGLIQRSPDPHDRRAMLVSLTAEGRRAGTAIRAARDADAERFFGALSDADRNELARILRTLRG